MLKYLKMTNVGPADMELELGDRLNILTGDNGLGKSFLLDIAWWAFTRKWPAEINPKLTVGKKALPPPKGVGEIAFSFTSKSKLEEYVSRYEPLDMAWTGRPGRPANPGLVLYAMSDGSFAVWDPARNYWRTRADVDVQDRPPAYVFSPNEIWDGLPGTAGTSLCNGLISDWAGWQKENGQVFQNLIAILDVLSPSPDEKLTPGPLTRISLDDVRDMPTLHTPYLQDVRLFHASAGMRRIVALAYLLTWAWDEHQKAARFLGEESTSQVIFLVDEIESHLHPSWQRRIIPALLTVMEKLTSPARVQLIAATHSPLVMASWEPIFDPNQDAWFDLDLNGTEVCLTHRDFEKHGDVSNWLTSEAFDLKSPRNIEAENLIEEAAELLDKPELMREEMEQMHERLTAALDCRDDFLFRWRAVCVSKGLLQ